MQPSLAEGGADPPGSRPQACALSQAALPSCCTALLEAVREAVREELASCLPQLLQDHVVPRIQETMGSLSQGGGTPPGASWHGASSRLGKSLAGVLPTVGASFGDGSQSLTKKRFMRRSRTLNNLCKAASSEDERGDNRFGQGTGDVIQGMSSTRRRSPTTPMEGGSQQVDFSARRASACPTAGRATSQPASLRNSSSSKMAEVTPAATLTDDRSHPMKSCDSESSHLQHRRGTRSSLLELPRLLPSRNRRQSEVEKLGTGSAGSGSVEQKVVIVGRASEVATPSTSRGSWPAPERPLSQVSIRSRMSASGASRGSLHSRVYALIEEISEAWRAHRQPSMMLNRARNPSLRRTTTRSMASVSSGGSASVGSQRSSAAQMQREQAWPGLGGPNSLTKVLETRQVDTSQSSKFNLKDPDSLVRRCLDVVGYVCLCWELICLPFQSAFLTDEDFERPIFMALSTVHVFIEFFWLAELIFNLVLFHYSGRAVQSDQKAVSPRHLSPWVVVDFAATVPRLVARILSAISVSEGHVLTLMRCMYLLRVLKLAKLEVEMRRLEAHMKSQATTSAMTLARLLMLPIVSSHFVACLLWALGRQNLENNYSAASWIRNGLPLPHSEQPLARVPVTDRYVCALYFSVTVMSTVGLGDISAQLENERMLLLVVMISTSLIVGVAVNGVSKFFSKLGERSSEMNERLVKVASFMRAYQVPNELQMRVHAYLTRLFENQDREQIKRDLMKWIRKSDLLHTAMNLSLTGRCLTEHRLLAELPQEQIVDICNICEMVFEPPGAILEEPGSEVQRCFYIRAGSVQLSERQPVLESCLSGTLSEPMTKRWDRGSPLARSESDVIVSQDDDLEYDQLRHEWSADVVRVDQYKKAGTYESGSFLSDMRLFLGVLQTQRTTKCTSFCELISLDIGEFRQRTTRMSAKNYRILPILSIYAACELDCPAILLHLLRDWEHFPDKPLLYGETALHECAKRDSARCASLLISAHANVEVLDADEMSACQLAAELKNKAVFEVLVLSGATADESALPSNGSLVLLEDDVSMRGGRWSHLSGASESFVIPDLDTDGFAHFMECYNLSSDTFGGFEAGMDLVAQLFQEYRDSECTLHKARGKLRRRVSVLRLRLMAQVEEHIRMLVEVQPDAWVASSDPSLTKLPSKKIIRGNMQEALEALLEKLGVSFNFYREHVVQLSKRSYAEVKPSMTYKGLETEYTCIEIAARLPLDGGFETASIGLPGGMAFEREELSGGLSLRRRVYLWPVLDQRPPEFDIYESALQFSDTNTGCVGSLSRAGSMPWMGSLSNPSVRSNSQRRRTSVFGLNSLGGVLSRSKTETLEDLSNMLSSQRALGKSKSKDMAEAEFGSQGHPTT